LSSSSKAKNIHQIVRRASKRKDLLLTFLFRHFSAFIRSVDECALLKGEGDLSSCTQMLRLMDRCTFASLSSNKTRIKQIKVKLSLSIHRLALILHIDSQNRRLCSGICLR
jgi:hypothetical protein